MANQSPRVEICFVWAKCRQITTKVLQNECLLLSTIYLLEVIREFKFLSPSYLVLQNASEVNDSYFCTNPIMFL